MIYCCKDYKDGGMFIYDTEWDKKRLILLGDSPVKVDSLDCIVNGNEYCRVAETRDHIDVKRNTVVIPDRIIEQLINEDSDRILLRYSLEGCASADRKQQFRFYSMDVKANVLDKLVRRRMDDKLYEGKILILDIIRLTQSAIHNIKDTVIIGGISSYIEIKRKHIRIDSSIKYFRYRNTNRIETVRAVYEGKFEHIWDMLNLIADSGYSMLGIHVGGYNKAWASIEIAVKENMEILDKLESEGWRIEDGIYT